ncbi:MAG: Fic family protein [Patescibacteria group bacterium]
MDFAKKSKKTAITTADILKLHSFVADQLLPENKVGVFRPGNIYIIDIIKGEEVVRCTGPDVSQVKDLLSELLNWIEKQEKVLHPVLLTGIIHYEFVSIHPFSDGNGRVTRLLVKLLLDLLDYDFRGCLVLDTYYWENTNKYYQSLNQANNYADQREADLTSWLRYFVEGFYQVSKDLERKISIVSSDNDDLTIRLNNQEMQILDFVNQFGQINLSEAVDVLQVPERTIQRRLKTLVDKNILEIEGKGKNTVYRLNKINQK